MHRGIGLAVLAGACGILGVAISHAKGPSASAVGFPERFAEGVLYTTVDRADIKQYRELFATPEAIQAVKSGKPIPSGTILTLVQYKAKLDSQGAPEKDKRGRFIKGDLVGYAVMEKRTGWGVSRPDEIRNGDWDYQAFKADKSINEQADLRNCFVCHKPLEKSDFVFSLEAMKSAKK